MYTKASQGLQALIKLFAHTNEGFEPIARPRCIEAALLTAYRYIAIHAC